MPEFIALTCLKCGGKLQIREDKTEFTCPYCGTSHIYNPDQGMFFVSQIEKSLKNVEKGVDKTASELAIRRLKEELDTLPFGGNIREIKDEIWQYENLKTAIKEAVQFLLKQQNPDKSANLLKKIFVGEYSESEIKKKFFSKLSENELTEMIDFCTKSIDLGFLEKSYKTVNKRLKSILRTYQIQKELDFHNKVVSQQ